jgi:hypothetical protein
MMRKCNKDAFVKVARLGQSGRHVAAAGGG